ncbi:hypothetical protein [Parasphingorhabdus sp.]|jgi:hypothetical protein|uniref:hypothetical protein n=1 Tax=Parasphingorhabdus sp. TaxID=2709688 RepID=UPI003001BA4E
MKNIVSIMILTGLVACGPAQNDPGPGGVTVGEAKALDEAAEMLDERNLPPESIENSETVPAETN